MAIQVNQPYDQFFEADGSPLDNGYIYIGTSGLNPVTNPLAVYWDVGLTIPATQPLRTMNGYIVRNGTPARPFVSPDDYSMLLKSSDGTTIWSALSAVTISGDPVTEVLADLAASNGASLIGYEEPDSLEVTTVEARLNLLDGVEVQNPTNADSYARAPVNAVRDTTGVSGGAGGFVNPTICARTTTGVAQTSFEWSILGILNNYSNGAAENVAGYFQGNKHGTAATWGLVAEAKDHTNTADPVAGLIGLEIDCFANGTDANARRLGIDLVIGKGDPAGTLPTIYAGIRIIPFNGLSANGVFEHGILMDADFETAIRIANRSGTWGILMTGSMSTGIDISGGTYTDDAIRIPADAGAGPAHTGIGFDSSGNHKLFYSSHATGLGLFYANAGTTLMSILDTGIINFFGPIKINNNQVVSDRATGYTNAMTGTANRATAYDTATITLVQLAQRVKALTDDLRTHGLIGA